VKVLDHSANVYFYKSACIATVDVKFWIAKLSGHGTIACFCESFGSQRKRIFLEEFIFSCLYTSISPRHMKLLKKDGGNDAKKIHG
jgi:hypothetical protein